MLCFCDFEGSSDIFISDFITFINTARPAQNFHYYDIHFLAHHISSSLNSRTHRAWPVLQLVCSRYIFESHRTPESDLHLCQPVLMSLSGFALMLTMDLRYLNSSSLFRGFPSMVGDAWMLQCMYSVFCRLKHKPLLSKAIRHFS